MVNLHTELQELVPSDPALVNFERVISVSKKASAYLDGAFFTANMLNQEQKPGETLKIFKTLYYLKLSGFLQREGTEKFRIDPKNEIARGYFEKINADLESSLILQKQIFLYLFS